MKRFQVISTRRTSRFTVYAVYDNEDKTTLQETSSRDKEKVKAEAKRLNDGNQTGVER